VRLGGCWRGGAGWGKGVNMVEGGVATHGGPWLLLTLVMVLSCWKNAG